MPTYEFKCNECGSKFEIKCSISDYSAEQKCPNGHDSVSRIYSPPAIRVQTAQEANARRMGGKKRENMMKEVRAKREDRKRDSNSSDRQKQSNELWVQ